MSRTTTKVQAVATEEETVETAQELAEATEEKAVEESAGAKTTGSRVYCGPSVRGVARQYTVYTGELPEELKTFADKHPAARALIVPASRFAEVRKRLETAGTAESILYKKIKAEL